MRFSIRAVIPLGGSAGQGTLRDDHFSLSEFCHHGAVVGMWLVSQKSKALQIRR